METFQASEHDGRGLVAPCVCLLLDFEQERFKLVDVFVHRLFIQALLKVLRAIPEDLLRLTLMLAYRLALLHPDVIRIDHLIEASLALESLRDTQRVDDQRPRMRPRLTAFSIRFLLFYHLLQLFKLLRPCFKQTLLLLNYGLNFVSLQLSIKLLKALHLRAPHLLFNRHFLNRSVPVLFLLCLKYYLIDFLVLEVLVYRMREAMRPRVILLLRFLFLNTSFLPIFLINLLVFLIGFFLRRRLVHLVIVCNLAIRQYLTNWREVF